MGTRSRIGIRNSDDSVVSIYCHWDGYPEHNGRILVDHYADEVKVRKLMALGNLSTLGANIGSKHHFDSALTLNECNAYGRDRGDKDYKALHNTTVQEFLDIDYDQEYSYIFHYGRWMVFCTDKWRLVTDVLATEAA